MNNKDFKKFCEILEGKEGCNFREKVKDDPKSITWKCWGNHKLAKKILKKYFPKEDVNKFLEHCKNNGGYCDCEILFNVK